MLALFILAGVASRLFGEWNYGQRICVRSGLGWKGTVTAVSILTPEGDGLFVVRNPVGDELLKLVEQNIKVTGAVLIDESRKENFTVYKYEIAYN